jgi:transposase
MMSDSLGKTYRPWEPQHYRQEAHSPEAQLPEGDVVFFLLETVPHLAWSRFYAPDEDDTRGAPPFDPQMMVCLLRYAYCVGGLSSRTMAQACERHLAFIAMVGAERPDFRTISDVRQLHLEAFDDVCVQGLRGAGESGLVQWGNVSTDGPTLQGQASRHHAMSYGYRQKEVERVREAMAALVTQASHQDTADAAALGSRRGDALPAALARRADRWATIEAAMRRVAARAKAAAEAERQRRAEAAAARQRTGTKRRGTVPTEVDETPGDTTQMRCTAPELGIMHTHKKGWADCGHAHASVDGASQIIVACEGTAAANDTQHALPMAQVTLLHLERAGMALPKDAAGAAPKIPATSDRGSDREAAAEAVEQLGCEPSRAPGRQRHHAPEAEVAATPTTAQERMAATVRTSPGRAWYARRQVIVEPVCGQSKAARGFRRFLRRGLDTIRGEWRLVCLTHNLRKLWRYA